MRFTGRSRAKRRSVDSCQCLSEWPVTYECYAELKDSLLSRLKAALPVDGVLLGLHGASAAESTGDLEGDLRRMTRMNNVTEKRRHVRCEIVV